MKWLIPVLALVGCESTPPLTELIVEVDSTFPEDEVAAVVVTATRGGNVRTVTLDAQLLSFPMTANFAWREGLLGPVVFVAEALAADSTSLVRSRAAANFEVGESLPVPILLSPTCTDCSDQERCDAGRCEPLAFPDGGMSDGGTMDQRTDRSVDQRIDAPTDAPSDCLMRDGNRSLCRGECTCRIDCDDDCEVECRENATCVISVATGAEANVLCEGAESCTVSASGRTDLRCRSGDCSMVCDEGVRCDFRCELFGDCNFQCGDPGECEYRSCLSFTQGECDDGSQQCGTDCPSAE
ncbi:MAG: hypothetical protein AAF411_04150 [Myxococcota bacterium]